MSALVACLGGDVERAAGLFFDSSAARSPSSRAPPAAAAGASSCIPRAAHTHAPLSDASAGTLSPLRGKSDRATADECAANECAGAPSAGDGRAAAGGDEGECFVGRGSGAGGGGEDGRFPEGSWLALLKKQEEQLDDILRRVEERGEPYRDPLFPAGPQALGQGCTGAAEVVAWRRPVELWEKGEPFLFKGAVAPSDVVQGRLKDCWLLGVVEPLNPQPSTLNPQPSTINPQP
jgi:hypothetical protein